MNGYSCQKACLVTWGVWIYAVVTLCSNHEPANLFPRTQEGSLTVHPAYSAWVKGSV